MNIGLEYIKYRWKAKKRHGIHSPFVYDLSDKCLSINIDTPDAERIKNQINRFKSSTKTITVDDFGAGSKRLTNKRSIRSILKTSSSRGRYGKLLYQIARHYQPQHVLELGTSLGIGTLHLKLGSPRCQLTTVEACKNTQSEAIELIKNENLQGVTSVLDTFENYLTTSDKVRFDLVFIDGHHDGDALIHYLQLLDDFIHDDSLVLLDDIRWSPSMKNAWDQIVHDPRFHVTIDFFRLGLISKRPQQEKEHFTLLP